MINNVAQQLMSISISIYRAYFHYVAYICVHKTRGSCGTGFCYVAAFPFVCSLIYLLLQYYYYYHYYLHSSLQSLSNFFIFILL
jgi:hypothetical protein